MVLSAQSWTTTSNTLMVADMYKSTAESNQFYRREGSFSTRPSVRGANLLNWEMPEELTTAEQIDCLRRRIAYLTTLLEQPLTKNERKEIGMEISRRCSEIGALRPRRLGVREGLSNFILDVVKENVAKRDWNRFVDEGMKRCDAYYASNSKQSASAPASQPGTSLGHDTEEQTA